MNADAEDLWTGRIEDDRAVARRRPLRRRRETGRRACGLFRALAARLRQDRADRRSEAKSAPGVVAVLTAADLAEAHYHSISHPVPIPGRGGKMAVSPHRPALAEKRVMHVGEPVAMVVAVTAAAGTGRRRKSRRRLRAA